jgi:hypothetical protein
VAQRRREEPAAGRRLQVQELKAAMAARLADAEDLEDDDTLTDESNVEPAGADEVDQGVSNGLLRVMHCQVNAAPFEIGNHRQLVENDHDAILVQNVEERQARVDLDNTRQITYGLGIVFLAVIRLRTQIVPAPRKCSSFASRKSAMARS